MEWGILVLLLVQCWWLWEIRRKLGVRTPTRLVRRLTPALQRADFHGAIPPSRFCVVRWPDGLLLYSGCMGAAARDMFAHSNPQAGEEIELWELGDCRGVKS